MGCNRFENKTAIVTGSARGFGKAIAVKLAADGAEVVIADFREELAENTADEIRKTGGKAYAYCVDVSKEDQVNGMYEAVLEKSGKIDILVNNAGIMRTTRPMESIPVDEFDAMMTVNIRGVFLCMKAVLPHMKERKSGKIVNVSSSAGRSMSSFNGAHYTASKAAILGLTRHAANESAPSNININAIAPGTFATEGGVELFPEVTPELLDQLAQGIPMKRLGEPEDIGNLVAFLCSEESSYITGATIDINAGELMM